MHMLDPRMLASCVDGLLLCSSLIDSELKVGSALVYAYRDTSAYTLPDMCVCGCLTHKLADVKNVARNKFANESTWITFTCVY
jgi:hypothetical protein